ncbi:hypothetical protein ACVWXM_006894 [Bradyrhizobium sp. GM7.3]
MFYVSVLPFLCSIKCRTIPPSRPKLAKPTRAAAVQRGRKAGAKRLYPGRARARRHSCIFFERSLCAAVPLFVALTVSNAAAVAETRPAELTASYRTGNSFADFVEASSRRFGMPVRWILAVIDVESAGDMRAKSPKGAMGLMQIMPEIWAELRLRYDLGNDPYDPHDNILAGTAYLRELRDRYGAPGLFAAYNAGPARYDERLAGRPLPVETEAYLRKLAPVIGSDLTTSSAVARLRSSAGELFVVRPGSPMSAARRPPKRAPTAASIHDVSAIVPQATGLFVARSGAGGAQ